MAAAVLLSGYLTQALAFWESMIAWVVYPRIEMMRGRLRDDMPVLFIWLSFEA
jgi:hypothetical protein